MSQKKVYIVRIKVGDKTLRHNKEFHFRDEAFNVARGWRNKGYTATVHSKIVK